MKILKDIIGCLAIIVPWLIFSSNDPGGDVSLAFWQFIGAAAGAVGNRVSAGFNDGSNPNADAIAKMLTSPFEGNANQALLPPSLRFTATGRSGARPSPFARGGIEQFLDPGVEALASLAASPGVLSSGVSPALSATTSLQSQAARSASAERANRVLARLAKSGASGFERNLAEAALNVEDESAQRGIRGQGLSRSDQLVRSDLQGTMNLLDALLQFMSSGRGQSIAGLQGAAQLSFGQQALANQQRAATLASLGTALNSAFAGRG